MVPIARTALSSGLKYKRWVRAKGQSDNFETVEYYYKHCVCAGPSHSILANDEHAFFFDGKQASCGKNMERWMSKDAHFQ